MIFNVSTNATLNRKAYVKEVHFITNQPENCKEFIMKNSSMVLRTLFIVIAGVVITTLWVQAV